MEVWKVPCCSKFSAPRYFGEKNYVTPGWVTSSAIFKSAICANKGPNFEGRNVPSRQHAATREVQVFGVRSVLRRGVVKPASFAFRSKPAKIISIGD